MKKNIRSLVIGGAVAMVFSAGAAFAQTPPSPIPHHPHSLPKHSHIPQAPGHGPHSHQGHGPQVHAAVGKHAADSCSFLAHHFVGTVNHELFMKECNNSHHNVLTHVPHAGQPGGQPRPPGKG